VQTKALFKGEKRPKVTTLGDQSGRKIIEIREIESCSLCNNRMNGRIGNFERKNGCVAVNEEKRK